MTRTVLSTFCLILTLAMQAGAQSPEASVSGQISTVQPAPAKKSKFSADWRLRLSGNDQSDEQSQSKYVDLRFDLRSKYLLTSSFYLDLQPSIRLVSGQNQSIDGADKMENKILLNQAAAHYVPFESLHMAAGALSQRFMHSTLLIDDISFPAARIVGLVKSGSFESGLAVETAIPTSTSLSTNTKELEPTPSLNTAALLIKWGDRQTFWKTNVGYFMYNNLPSAVAQQSLLLGNNSVGNLSDAQYYFTDKYQGIEASTEVQIPLGTTFDALAGAEYLRNDKVASDQGTAYKVSAGTNIHMTRGLDWTVTGSYFSIAPEAAVSYFNARGYETNRVGYGAETYLSFRKEGFKIGVQYKEAEVMFENPVQSREKSLMIKLETFYANI